MKATVIIAAFSRSKYLQDTLACLQKQSVPVEEFEIIVVDNSADGQFKQQIEALKYNNVRYIWEPRPGKHRACNTAALEAKGQVLIFIDDDELFDEKLVHFLSESLSNKEIGCVGGRMLPKFELTELPPYFSVFNRGDISHLDYGEAPMILRNPESDVWGGNMAIRRDVYLEVGGMNPDIFPDSMLWLTGDGECGLQHKIRALGLKIYYEPRACIYNRINAARLTKEFLLGRRKFASITMSFTNIRQLKHEHFFVLRIIKHAIHCYVNALNVYFIKRYKSQLERRVEFLFWFIRAQHHMRAAVSRQYRDYVIQDSYL